MTTPITREITLTSSATDDNFIPTMPTIENAHNELDTDPTYAYTESVSPLDTPYM